MKSTKCLACGFVGRSDLEYCKACGAAFGQNAAYYAQVGWNESEGEKKGLAIASLVLGILSFATLGLLGVGAIIGIVLAVMAMSRVKNEPRKYGGKGIAIAGLVLSITSIAVAVPIGIVAAIAIPNLMASRIAANEGAAIQSLRTISSAEIVYQNQFQKYGTLEELGAVNLIDSRLASGTKSGYRFTVELTSESSAEESNVSPGGFKVVCVPAEYRSSGRRSFFVDETQVVRGADNVGLPSSEVDPPLETRPMRASWDRQN